MLKNLTFQDAYREDVRLSDGTPVRFRMVRPTDGRKLANCFDRFSAQTRQRRFHYPKNELSRQEIRFFTDVDGWDHLAILALIRDSGNSDECIGVGRFLRLIRGGRVAEVAIAVADDYQRRGLGTRLLARLVAAARERGIDRLRFYLLAHNRAARDLIERSVWSATFENQGTVVAAEIEVPDAIPPSRDTLTNELSVKLAYLLRLAATGCAFAPCSLSMVDYPSWWEQVKRLSEQVPAGAAPSH